MSYAVYTRRHDRVVGAGELDSILGPLSSDARAAFEAACAAYESGLSGWQASLDVAAIETGARIAAALTAAERRDTAVAFLVDNSGSMRGQRMALATTTVASLTDMLVSLGISVEVLGFTTVSWKGGKPRRTWRWLRRPRPGRLCEVLHIIYRDGRDQSSRVPWSIRNMLRPDLPKENVDGEAVEWAAQRLTDRRETRKILLVLSDGAPVDDSTILANSLDFLPDHLKSVVRGIEQEGRIEIGAVDICSGHAKNFYDVFEEVDAASDLGVKTLALLERLIARNDKQAKHEA
jgi:cobaltochelatase CobT